MTPQRFQKIYDLFIKAREQPPDARCRFLNQACPEDDQLQREVEALLAAEVSPERLQTLTAIEIRQALAELENRAAEQVDSDGLPAGLHIEGFEILRELHRGGQGVVYQAVQRSTKRKVAIKVLLEGPYASRASKRRFERETELVAQLKHPNITAVFDSGLTADNRHYCVMDYVRGTPLQRYVRENGVGLEDAARLFAKVCDAVNYAHQKGVIHRDLKPSNILVDSDGEPKLLDFGLAKMVSAPVETIVSMTGQVVGTLPYMSPEQARGNPDEIDTRTDVYALGVIFYELLTGHYPYPVAGQMAEVLKHIAETPPTPPSRKWSKDSGITKRSDKRLRLGQCPIDDELQTIALKALAKERERRYQSAGGLVRDIEHYLAGEPIEAKRDSGLYVLKKTLKRYRAPVLVVALFVLLQAIGFVWIYALYSERGVHITEVESQLAAVCARLVQEGRDMMNRKHWDLAVQKFDEALDLDPDFYPAIGSKAYALKKKYFAKDFKFGQTAILEESARLCDRALELRPDRVGLWNLKAVLAYSLGDLQVAKAACLHALSLDPKYFNARSNLAKVLALQHEFKSALEEANTGVQVAATMAEDQFSDSVWRTLGVLQFHMGQAEAFESLKKAKSIAQDDAKNWLILARLYLGPRGYLDAPSAVREAEGAATFDKQSDPRISRMLALAYLRDQQYGEAVRHAQAAIENGDVHSYGHMIAAIAYAQMGDVRNAGLQLDRAVERLPSFDEDGTVVVCEKGLLWIDTAEELQTLRGEAEKLTDASQIQKGD